MRYSSFIIFLAWCTAFTTSAAGLSSTGYFTPECLKMFPENEFRADIESALKRAEKNEPAIEALCAQLQKDGSPRFNAVKKRAKILNALRQYASTRFASGSSEMLLCSWATHKEMQMLLDYFESEAKLQTELHTLPAPQIFSAASFGAKGNGKGNDGPAIRKAIDAAAALGKPAKVFLPAGTYRIEPDPNLPEIKGWINRLSNRSTSWNIAVLQLAHLRLVNPNHITLEGEPGTKLLFTNPALCGIRILGGYHTTLRNLTIDYETLPFTQGEIISATSDRSTIEVKIDPGFPFPDSPDFLNAPSRRITPIDPASRNYLWGTYPIGKVEALDERRFRIQIKTFRVEEERINLNPGNLVVITGRYDAAKANAVNSMLSKFDVYENIVIHSSPSWAFMEFSEAPILTGCRVETPQKSSRATSTNGDGLMAFAAHVGPYLENCHFSSTEDDGVNLQAATTVITAVCDNGRYMEPRGEMREPGVLVIDGNNGKIKAVARIIENHGKPEFSPPLPNTVISSADLKQKILSMNEQLQQKTMYQKEKVVKPDVIISLDRTAGGTSIVNCSFQNIRGLGIQLSAPSVWVENSVFDTLTSAGISVTALTPWGMYYSTHNSAIYNCTFRNAAKGILLQYIRPYSDSPALTPRSLTGILIENNTFEQIRWEAIHLENCSDILLRGNRISLPPGKKHQAIYLNNCRDIIAEGNTLNPSTNRPLYLFANPEDENNFRENLKEKP